KKGDAVAEATAVDKLLTYYPSKELFSQVLSTTRAKKGFSERFSLDVLRLKLASGNLKADEYAEYAQLAAAAGFPEEGKMVAEKGMAAGALGQGAEAARDKRLLDFLGKKITENKAKEAEALAAANDARDGMGFVQIGLAQVFRGQGSAGVKV